MRILVTGAAGFIGFHTAKRLLQRGDEVVGFDVVNAYYDPKLKEARLAILDETARQTSASYHFIRADLADQDAVKRCFSEHRFDRVIHLAAQAGVRHSLEHPQDYVRSNIVAFTNILEACRYNEISHLTYASTSSVYGANTKMPFSEHVGVDHPLQFYAATKRANELMAHAYSHLFHLPTTGLRFFTVYGPWGRPDMALFLFTKAILAGEPIKLFNHGNHTRDFTYVDDIVEGVIRTSDQIAAPDPDWSSDQPDPATSNAPFRIFNIGNNQPVKLMEYVTALEETLGRRAIHELLPLQPGDVPDTFADVSKLEHSIGYKPRTPVREGVASFVEWYRDIMSEVPERVAGLRLTLRLIQPDDADYVYALRNNPAYNAHLSPVIGTTEDQRRWIEAYKAREAEGREAYYIIERRADGQSCGVVRLYGIEKDRFTWGSWILDASKPPKAALESAVLSFGVGFENYKKYFALIDVRLGNKRAITFYRRLGMLETRVDIDNIYFTYSREQFLADRPGYLQIIQSSGESS